MALSSFYAALCYKRLIRLMSELPNQIENESLSNRIIAQGS